MKLYNKLTISLLLFLAGLIGAQAATTVKIISPETLRSGEYLPVVVRFTTTEGKIDSTITGNYELKVSTGSLSKSAIKVFRGVGSITPRLTSSSDFSILTVVDFPGSRTVEIISAPETVNHQGTMSGSNLWNSDRVHLITGNLTIPAGVTLMIGAGSLIKIAQDANIIVNGTLLSEGSESRPIHWTSSTWGNHWGGIELNSSSSDSRFDYNFFTDGGGDQSRVFVHSNSQPVIKAVGTILSLDNCFFIDNKGKGVGTNESENYLNDCLFARCDIGAEFRFSNTFLNDVYTMFMPDENGIVSDVDNDGLYFWDIKSSGGVRSVLNHCVIHQSEDDGIDLNRDAKLSIRYSVISKVDDKGISVSLGGDLTVFRTSIINCKDYGLALKVGDVVVFDQGTLYGNGTGFKFYGSGDLTVKNTIISQSPKASISKDSDSRLSCTYTLSDLHTISGTGNLRVDPDFINPGSLDFRLQEGSPAIDAGNPSSPLDPDGTRTDMGAYAFSQVVEPITGIVANEVVSSYGSLFSDEFGNYSDWIELYNKNSFPVDIAGLYLSDDSFNPAQYRIPSGSSSKTTIPAHGFLVLFADNQPDLGPTHVGFQLSSIGEEIVIAQKIGTEIIILDEWSFPELTTDQSFGRFPDGTGTLRMLPLATPGSANINEVRDLKNVLFINEFMARYPNSYPDEHGQYSDWIEIFNAGDEDVNLGGLFLSDNKTTPTLHRITPGLGDSTVIKAGGFFVFRADRQPELGVNHVDFELAGAGEDVTLVQVTGGETIFIDSVHYGTQTTGVSYGRTADAQPGWRQFWTPTPGQSNSRTAWVAETGTMNQTISMYPNPFETSVNIRFQLAEPSEFTIRITDLTGKIVRSLHSGSGIPITAHYEFEWNGAGSDGLDLPDGVYAVTILPAKGMLLRSLLIKN